MNVFDNIQGTPHVVAESSRLKATISGHIYDLETKERLFYDGGLGKYDNFDLLRRLIIGPEKYIELNPEKVEKPRQLFDFSVRCNVCGRALTYKESVFCQENGLMPTCYQCQHSRN